MSLDQTRQRYRAAVQDRFLQSKSTNTTTTKSKFANAKTTPKKIDKQLEDIEEMEAVPPGVPTIVPSDESNKKNEEQHEPCLPLAQDEENVDVDLYEDEFEEVDDDACCNAGKNCCCKDVDDEDDEEDEDECCDGFEDDQYVDFDDDESVQTGCGDFDDEDDGMDDDELIASICAQEIDTPPPSPLSPPAPTVTAPKAKRGRKPKSTEAKEATESKKAKATKKKPKALGPASGEEEEEAKPTKKKVTKSTKKKPQNDAEDEPQKPEKKKQTKKKAEKAEAASKKRSRGKKAAAPSKASEETESDEAAEEPAAKPKRARTRKVVNMLRTLGQYERRIRTVATEEELSSLHGAFLTDFGLEAAIKRWRADTKKAEEAGQTVPYVHQAQVLAAVAHEKGYHIAGFTSENKVKGEFKPLPEGHTRATANVVYVGKVARGYGQTLWTLHKDDIIHESE